MTDEELAEEWVVKYLGVSTKTLREISIKQLRDKAQSLKEAYVAGLKAQEKWHDLRKNPNDLPDNSRYVWTNVGPGYHDDDGWWDDYGRLQDVIAWCEPKFEEETDENNNQDS